MTHSYIADIATQIRAVVPPEALPEGDTDALFLIYAVLALAKGNDVQPRDIHNAWAAWMSTRDPEHESIVPYENLPPNVKQEDDLFVAAVRQVGRNLLRDSSSEDASER